MPTILDAPGGRGLGGGRRRLPPWAPKAVCPCATARVRLPLRGAHRLPAEAHGRRQASSRAGGKTMPLCRARGRGARQGRAS